MTILVRSLLRSKYIRTDLPEHSHVFHFDPIVTIGSFFVDFDQRN